MKKKRKGSSSAYAVNEVEYQLPEEGLHKARPVRFLELGTVESEEWGDKFKVLVGYELVEHEPFEDSEGEERNFVVNRRYNKSLSKRSDLGKDVRAIMGKEFPEKGEFEMDEIGDRPCWVEITHSEDGQYANVTKVMKCNPSDLKGFPKAENNFVSLYLDENFDEAVYEDLSEGMREKIAESPEYQELFPDEKPKRKGKKRDDDEDEDEEEDDKPRRKRRSRDDDDEDEEDEDEDDEETDDEDEEEDDDKPRRKRQTKKKPVKRVPKKRGRR